MNNVLNRAAKQQGKGNLDTKRQVRHIEHHFLDSLNLYHKKAALFD